MRAILLVIVILALATCARAHALEIGARLPTTYGEVMVVRNDNGISNATTHFRYGSICHTDLNLRTWLIVKRIVGERVLIETDLSKIALADLACPHGTETSLPYMAARERYEHYKRMLDDKVFFELKEGN
jgi:hypothetical protein